jgi:hypothetical protein
VSNYLLYLFTSSLVLFDKVGSLFSNPPHTIPVIHRFPCNLLLVVCCNFT